MNGIVEISFRRKIEELKKELKKILDDKDYASGMFFGYIFNEIVNFPSNNILEATSLEELQEEARKRKILQRILESICKEKEIWQEKFEKEKKTYFIACAVNITPDEILSAKSLEQIQACTRDAIFCCSFCQSVSLWAGNSMEETSQENFQQYEQAKKLLFEIETLISKKG